MDVKDEKDKVIGTRPEIELEVGEFVSFSKAAANDIYSERGYLFVREQIDAAINERRNFLPNASRSSVSS